MTIQSGGQLMDKLLSLIDAPQVTIVLSAPTVFVVCVFISVHVHDMLNKNTLSIKKVQGQSEAALQIGMCDQKL